MAVAIKTTHATLALGKSATRAVMRNDVCTVAGQCIFFSSSHPQEALLSERNKSGPGEERSGEVQGGEDQ